MRRRQIVGWVGGATAIAALTGVLAAVAQHAARVQARPYVTDLDTYSLTGHVAAMTVLGIATVVVASLLIRQGRRWMAVVVLAAMASGPMLLIAAPLGAHFVSPTAGDSAWWWHLIVGIAAFAVLAGWTYAVTDSDPESTTTRTAIPFADSVFLVVGVGGFSICWNHSWELLESVGGMPALGWASLAAGVVVATAGAPWSVGVRQLVLNGLALGVMAHAYLRPGGWPGVAGWEFEGMESPVVLSAQVAVATAAAPLLGLAVRSAARLRLRQVEPASAG